jgi:multidrug resistance efflux pump
MKRFSFSWVMMLAVAVLLSACFPKPAIDTTLVLQNNTATPRPTDNRLRIDGRVVLAQPADLSFSLSGQIVAVNVKEGDRVEVGDEIARLDPGSLEIDVALAEASLAAAMADFDKARLPAHPAEIEELQIKATAAAAMRGRTLSEATQVAAEAAVAQAQLEFLLAQPLPQEVAVAQADVNLAQQRLEAAKVRLSQTVLVAPVSGTITRVYVHPYEYASTGSQVVQIADLGDVYVETLVSAEKAQSLKIGDPAILALSGPAAAEVEAAIVSIRPDTSSADGQAFVIAVAPKNATEALRWGATVQVILAQAP